MPTANYLTPLDQAIAEFEGFGNTVTAPSITNGNNPGAVQFGPLAQSYGATGAAENGAAVFPSLDAGIAALHAVESHIFSQGNTTPDSFITAYEGGVPNADYSQFVADHLGIYTGSEFPSQAIAAGNVPSDQTATPDKSAPVSGSGSGAGVQSDPLKYLSPGYYLGKGMSAMIPSVPWLRVAAFIIGAGLIIGGIFFLRPVQEVVSETTGAVRRGIATVS